MNLLARQYCKGAVIIRASKDLIDTTQSIGSSGLYSDLGSCPIPNTFLATPFWAPNTINLSPTEKSSLYETYISILTPSSKFLSLPILDNL